MCNTVKKYYDAKYENMEDSLLLHNQYLISLGIDFGEIVRLYHMLDDERALVLDLGCGGQASSYVFSPDSTARIVGVDISRPGLKLAVQGARQIGYPGIFAPVVGDGLHLPFRDGTFDSAVLYKSLEYMNSPHEVLGEVCRVLKKGGGIFICTLNEKYLVRKLIRLAKPSHWAGELFPRKPFFSLQEIETWFKLNGLRVQGHCFAFNYVSAFWDVLLLPRMIGYHMKRHENIRMNKCVKSVRSILLKAAIIDKPFKRWGDSSVLVVVGRKD